MNIKQAFPSRFLREADLGGIDRTVTIRKVEMVDVDDGELKPAAYFDGIEKALVLNVTNAGTISMLMGSEETNEWIGKQIILFPTTTEFKGKTTPCIRVRAAQQAAPASQPAAVPESSVFPPDV